VNDDELLAATRSTLTSVRDSLADVHLDRSASAIIARARARRRRRGLAGAAAVGVTALAVALAVGLVGLPLAWPASRPAARSDASPARSAGPGTASSIGHDVSASSGGDTGRSVHVNLDAWSVNTTPAGLVDVTIRELRDPALFLRTLAKAGVTAVVSSGEFCRPATSQGQLARQLVHVLRQSTNGGKVVLTINPAAMPAGSELDIGIMAAGRGLIAAFGLVEKGTALTRCSPQLSRIGSGGLAGEGTADVMK
jgi:hypothetical protein